MRKPTLAGTALLATLAAAALAVPGAARATVFDFAYDIPASISFPTAVTASGTLTADPTATPGEFLLRTCSALLGWWCVGFDGGSCRCAPR